MPTLPFDPRHIMDVIREGLVHQVLMGGGAGANPVWQETLALGVPLVDPNPDGAYLAVNTTSDYGGDLIHLQRDGSLAWRLTGTGQIDQTLLDGAANVVNPALLITHTTQGTATTGFGTGLRFALQTTNGTRQTAADLQILWTNAITSDRTPCMRFNLWDRAGVHAALAMETDGNDVFATMAGAPPAASARARLLLGSALSGSGSGTYLGIHADASFAGDAFHFLLNGQSRCRVDAAGALFCAGEVVTQGVLSTRRIAAPEAADLVAGQVALWFDATDGAARLKIVGKSLDGTVVTGQVALT